MAFAVYAVSLLLCPVILTHLWRNPSVAFVIFFFAIVTGTAGLVAIFIMRTIGPTYLFIAWQDLAGLSLSVGMLYVAALLWAMVVGFRRKRLGDFDVELVPFPENPFYCELSVSEDGSHVTFHMKSMCQTSQHSERK